MRRLATPEPGFDTWTPDRFGRGVLVALAALVAVCGFWLRWKGAHVNSADYAIYLRPWYDRLDRDGFGALAEPFASHNLPYLYGLWLGGALDLGGRVTVKGIAILGDLVAAGAVYRLVSGFRGRRVAGFAAGLYWLLPTVWANSAVWGQTDAWYTAFCVLAVDAVARRCPAWAWVWFGIALAGKLQAVFLLPWLGLVWLLWQRRRWWHPLLALLAPLVAVVPATLAGLPARHWFSAYAGQTTSPPSLGRSPVFWRLFAGGEDSLPFVPLAVPLAIAGTCLFGLALAQRHHWDLDPRRLVTSAAAVTMLVPFLLPNMRNRYVFLAQVLVLCWVCLVPERWWVAVLFELAVLPTYAQALLQVPPPGGTNVLVLAWAAVVASLVHASLTTPADLPEEAPYEA